MKVYAGAIEPLLYCCGAEEIGGFYLGEHPQGRGDGPIISRLEENNETTGLVVATFNDDEGQREAYEELCELTTLLYQSPVFINKGIGNPVFLCVFKKKD